MSLEIDHAGAVTAAGDRRSRFLVLGGLAVALLAAHAYYFDYTTDDAFITFRYFRHLLAGHGLVFNPGERVEGYTNFLWGLLLTLPAMLGVSFETAARFLGLLFAAGTLFLVLAIRRYSRSSEDGTCGGLVLTMLPATLLASNGAFATWALGGMESAFFAFLLCLLIFVRARDGRMGSPYATGAIAALLTMTRPDGAAFLGATLAHEIVCCRGARDAEADRSSLRAAATIMGAFLVLYLPYFIWRYAYYGYPLPNSFYAKVGFGAGELSRGADYVRRFLLSYGAVPLLGGIAAVLARRRIRSGRRVPAGMRSDSSYLWFLILAYVSFILLVGGDHLVMHRLFVPILPPIYLLTARGFSALLSPSPVSEPSAEPEIRRAHSRSPGRLAPLIALAFAAVIGTAAPSFRGLEHTRVFSVEKPSEADRKRIGLWLKENAPPGTTIAIIPAGIVPYYSDLVTIDLLGLNDVTIAHSKVAELGRGVAGHEKHNSRYVLARHPDIIFLGACRIWEKRMSVADLTRYYWAYGDLAPGNREMLGDPDLGMDYLPSFVHLASGYVHLLRRVGFEIPMVEGLAKSVADPLPAMGSITTVERRSA